MFTQIENQAIKKKYLNVSLNDEIEGKLVIYLKSANGSALETQIGLEILSDFSHQTLKGQLPDQQFSGFLVATNFTEGDGTRPRRKSKTIRQSRQNNVTLREKHDQNCLEIFIPVTMRFFHSSSGWSGFPCSLSSQLFAGSFSTGGFTSGLLGTCHFFKRDLLIFQIRYVRNDDP